MNLSNLIKCTLENFTFHGMEIRPQLKKKKVIEWVECRFSRNPKVLYGNRSLKNSILIPQIFRVHTMYVPGIVLGTGDCYNPKSSSLCYLHSSRGEAQYKSHIFMLVHQALLNSPTSLILVRNPWSPHSCYYRSTKVDPVYPISKNIPPHQNIFKISGIFISKKKLKKQKQSKTKNNQSSWFRVIF